MTLTRLEKTGLDYNTYCFKVLCDEAPEDPGYTPPPEERPGGYDWGGNNPEQNDPNPDNANVDDMEDNGDNGDNNNVLHNDENQNLQPL